MARNYAKKKKTHKAAMVTIFVVVAFFCGVINISNRNKQKELDEERREIEKLEEEIAKEEETTLNLDALKVYVTTMKYVEEKAKKLGLVYPDEIVFKPR